MQVQPEIDPRFAFTFEVLFVFFGLEHLRSRAFDGKLHVPATVPDPVDQPHPAAVMHVEDFVGVEDDVADVPDVGNVFDIAPGSPTGRRSRDCWLRGCWFRFVPVGVVHRANTESV